MKKLFTTLVLLLACTAMSYATTYTVAGSSAVLFDATWDPSSAANDMTQYGETVVYSWRKTGVALTAGTVEFKVCVDHAWNTAYPNENFVLNIPSDGTYDVTIIFNSENHNIIVNLETETDTWTAAGDAAVFGEHWDITDTGNANLMATTDGITYTLTKENVTLTPGTYGYKVVKNHSWDNENYGADGSNANNQAFTVDTEGIYDVAITFNYATKALSEVVTLKQAFTYKYHVMELTGVSEWTDLGEMTTVTEGVNADKEATLTVTRTFDAATTIKFKVAKQLYYGEDYQSETWLTGGDESTDWHATIDVAKASKYNITFNVYFSTKAIYGSAEEQFTGYNLITNEGAENAWIKGSALAESEGVYSITFSKPGKLFAIAPNTAFDASDNITWAKVVRPVTSGSDWALNYFVNYSGTTVSSESGYVWSVTAGNESNLTLAYTPADDKFSITTDAKETVTIASGNDGYATFSTNTGDYQINDVDVYIVTAAGTSATLTKLAADEAIPAGTGVIINNATPGTYYATPKAATASNADISENLLVGSNASTYDITGDLGGEGNHYYDGYVLANSTNGVGFYKVDPEHKTLAAHKAFLAANRRSTQAPALSVLDFISFSDVTAIEGIEAAKANIVEGCFNLAGQRVAQPTKGLYIVNGKKVVMK